MSDKDDLMAYDEDDSLAFIKKHLPEEMKDKFSDDDICYVVDLMSDYFESKGLFDEEVGEEDEIAIDEDELIDYAVKLAKKEGEVSLLKEEIAAIIEGELAYGDSIGLFD